MDEYIMLVYSIIKDYGDFGLILFYGYLVASIYYAANFDYETGLSHETLKKIKLEDPGKEETKEQTPCTNNIYPYISNNYVWSSTLHELSEYIHNQDLIHCEYCESDVAPIHINCPNCGAPLGRRR